MENYVLEYKRWLASDALTDAERRELLDISDNAELMELRFSSPMSFGTAGLRSTMYLGIGCMNRFTVAATTRAIADIINSEGNASRGVAIAYDSRNNSKEFAKVSAEVLAGAGIRVFIFDSLRPTPELSFAVRELNAIAGINITASHNPKEYNGYKAYWEDGAQIGPEIAEAVSSKKDSFDVLDTSGMLDFEEGVLSGIITILGEEFDERYMSAVLETSVNESVISEVSDELRVVYTALHGAGARLVPEIFRRRGLKYLYTVEEQMQPDGNFPTVEKPNPEYSAVFKLGISVADKNGADLIIATDPDSDRVGVMARGADGIFRTITGNQMGALLLDYVISARKRNRSLTADDYAVKSIVSTDMASKIAEVNGIKLYDVLTGFKYIGEVIKNYKREERAGKFLLGFEESYGYLLGTYARDKDAVEASMIILEATAYYKSRSMTLIDAIDELYKKYGLYLERTVDIYMEGLDGIRKRREVMQRLRDCVPTEFGGCAVVSVADYKSGKITDTSGNILGAVDQPTSDVLYYTLDGGDKIIVRPSGTEPKIKIYLLLHGEDKESLERKANIYETASKRIAEV